MVKYRGVHIGIYYFIEWQFQLKSILFKIELFHYIFMNYNYKFIPTFR